MGQGEGLGLTLDKGRSCKQRLAKTKVSPGTPVDYTSESGL